MAKPTIAVHKFASCDGCQLAFLNAGEALLELAGLVEIVHFAEAGACNVAQHVDIAFVEGSLTAPHDLERIQQVRANSDYLITIGACATSGGVQALRNLAADKADWPAAIYARPEYIHSLADSTPVSAHVHVDLEIWGCPVNGKQVLAVVRDLLFGVQPRLPQEKVCMECKRRNAVCVMVSRGEACMGPVTKGGCGAICPHMGRGCYACYGPAENSNTAGLSNRLHGIGYTGTEVQRRFWLINSGAPEYRQAGEDNG